MPTRFSVTIAGIPFEFLSMDVSKPRLFQVHATFENARTRFHMQADVNGVLKITLKDDCPKIFQELEAELAEAILQGY